MSRGYGMSSIAFESPNITWERTETRLKMLQGTWNIWKWRWLRHMRKKRNKISDFQWLLSLQQVTFVALSPHYKSTKMTCSLDDCHWISEILFLFFHIFLSHLDFLMFQVPWSIFNLVSVISHGFCCLEGCEIHSISPRNPTVWSFDILDAVQWLSGQLPVRFRSASTQISSLRAWVDRSLRDKSTDLVAAQKDHLDQR